MEPIYKLYIFDTNFTQSRVNPACCGWGSQGMIRLYKADKNTKWLTYAKNNIDGLNKACRDTTINSCCFFARPDDGDRAPKERGVTRHGCNGYKPCMQSMSRHSLK